MGLILTMQRCAPLVTLVATALLVVAGCGPYGSESDDRSYTSEAKANGKKSAGNAQKTTCLNDTGCPSPTPTPPAAALEPPCTLPAGASNSFTTTQGMIALINAMPKPLSIACFLEVLPENHQLAGSSSGTSAQPAHGSDDPRLFFVMGDMLLGVVPAGPNKDFLEFSMLVGTTESVKGEVKFPVTADLESVNPFARVLNAGRSGTTCGLCHVNETDTSTQFGTGSYQSRALRPTVGSTLSMFDIQSIADRCSPSDSSERCRIWRAAYRPGKTAQYVFPSDMPVLGQP